MNVSPIDITIEDILSTISEMTKIPLATLSSHDLSNLKDIGNNIKKEVIGQDDAIEKAVKAIQKKRIGLKTNTHKPPVLMLIGSSGVGKTLLAKTVAKTVFHDEKNMIRIDCSELSQEHDVAKLIGSPPGYIGFNRPLLLDKMRENPYCVLLWDEIEKANPTAYNLMLQIFDDGRLSTASGDLIDFSNSIIFITSNIGTKTASEYKNIGFTSDNINKDTKSEDIIKKSLKKQFAPEFLNRIDSVIYFNSLNESVLKKIIDINLNKLKIVLNEKQEKYDIKWNDDIVNFLYSKLSQDDKNLGARPILRLIDQYVENPLIDSLIENEYSDGYEFNIIGNGEELIIK
jgi:ATP-dependent Clp protease ATP-binding subunit ClpC